MLPVAPPPPPPVICLIFIPSQNKRLVALVPLPIPYPVPSSQLLVSNLGRAVSKDNILAPLLLTHENFLKEFPVLYKSLLLERAT